MGEGDYGIFEQWHKTISAYLSYKKCLITYWMDCHSIWWSVFMLPHHHYCKIVTVRIMAGWCQSKARPRSSLTEPLTSTCFISIFETYNMASLIQKCNIWQMCSAVQRIRIWSDLQGDPLSHKVCVHMWRYKFNNIHEIPIVLNVNILCVILHMGTRHQNFRLYCQHIKYQPAL